MPNPTPSQKPGQSEDLTGAMDLVLRKFLLDVDDMLPARIVSYDPPPVNRAQIEILYKVTMTDGSLQEMSAPAEVPVEFPGGGGYVLTFPLKPGSLGWIKAVDRDMSLFLQSYEAEPGNTARLHCFEDGVFRPDVMTAFEMADSDGISLQTTDGNSAVTVNSSSAVMKVGTATLTLTEAKLVSSVPIEAPKVKAGDVEMLGHNHSDPEGGNVGPAKNP
ncbi:Gp138 family membrane-puncturing spike protein [Cronobacter turicensis]|nr:hypothetical protein [Cronobacter turicensis]